MKRRNTFFFACCFLIMMASLGGLSITIRAADINGTSQRQRKIALTFDDLPMTVVGNDHIAGPFKETQDICRSILRTLLAHRATAIGFVNEIKLNVPGERDMRAALLDEWLNGNMLLGNHGYEHLAFSAAGLAAYEEQFLRGDTITRTLLEHHRITRRYFRHPYLDTGKSAQDQQAFAAMLTAHNYRIAPVTIENSDWMFNASYYDARNRQDKAAMQRATQAYLAQTAASLENAEQLSRATFSREISLVMLMHANRLSADRLDDVLRLLERRGYRCITIDEALEDRAYETPDKTFGNKLGSWLDRWQLSFGRQIVHASGPTPPEWIQNDYKRIAGSTLP